MRSSYSPIGSSTATLRLRSILSVLLTVAILLGPMHHSLCGTEAEASQGGASIVLPFKDLMSPGTQADGFAGHCHCLCHVTAESRVVLISSPLEYATAEYGCAGDHLWRSLASAPPFKPPRA